MSRLVEARFARVVAFGLLLLALAVAAIGLERRNTWYLASDQFAFLAFADDVGRGRVTRPDDAILRLGARPSASPRDALYGTYFWTGTRLYSRYPPGFPALLAAAGAVGGERGRHLLNPLLFLALAVVLALACWEALRGHDRSMAAGVAVGATWLLVVLPTQFHLWGITVARDPPAHLAGLLAVLAAIVGAPGVAGLLLGLACTVRPDAALWGASVAAVLLPGRPRARDWGLLVAGGLVGVLPLLLYNRATTGRVLSFTQGGEFDRLLSALRHAPLAVVAQAGAMPSGGGFRLRHLATTLPGNAALLLRGFSWTAALALVGIGWSARRRRILLAAFLPYAALALPFYGCWSHPDARYLAGVSLGGFAFAATGAVVACRRAADARSPAVRGAIAAVAGAVVAAGLLLPGPRGAAVPGAPEAALAAAIGFAALLPRPGSADGGLRIAGMLPAVALAALALVRVASGGGRDPFQRPQVLRATAAVEALVPAGSLVLVDGALGRPAENIARYTRAESQYASELGLLGTHPSRAAVGYALEGRRVFALVGAGEAPLLATLGAIAVPRLVERRDGDALLDWFVDPGIARGGAALWEFAVRPDVLEAARAGTAAGRRPPG